MSNTVNIVERKSVPEGLVLFQGLPDVGLVGVIAASHIAQQLKMEEVAYINSSLLPPVILLKNGLPHSPIRIFGNDTFLTLTSDIPLPPNAVQPIIHALIEWIKNKKVKMVFGLSGIAVPNRQDIEKPKVYSACSTKEILETLKEKGMTVIENAFLVGPLALTLHYCAENEISAVALLAESFYNYPDPEAAAAVITALNEIVEVPVEVSTLIEKGEEIRLKMRDIMKRTQPAMAQMRKSREYDMPGYYVA